MSCSKSEQAALTRLFSTQVYREFGRHGQSPLFIRLVQQIQALNNAPPGRTLGELLDYAFSIIQKSRFRDEYIYRSAITQKIALGRHSLGSATAINEFRAGKSRADIAIFNGASVAYEIKSERDSLMRLESQISDYRKVFAEVNVLTSETHLDDVISIVPRDVGILLLSQQYTIQTVRAAQTQPQRTTPTEVLNSIRLAEANAILKSLDIRPPRVPNTELRTELTKIFARLDPSSVQSQVVRILKLSRSRSHLAEPLRVLPRSLHALALSTEMKLTSHMNVARAMSTPFQSILDRK